MTRPLGGAFKSVQSDLKGSVGPNQEACLFSQLPQVGQVVQDMVLVVSYPSLPKSLFVLDE